MAAEPEEMDLLLILFHTAARVGEVLRMPWEDVNLEKRWVRLWTRKRRGGNLQEDMLPMNETLHGIMERRWRNRNKEEPVCLSRIPRGRSAAQGEHLPHDE